jgi:hypothetical protein
LRTIGFSRGFQWLDGSFVEQKDPADIDVVTFLYRPAHIQNHQELGAIVQANAMVFHREAAKVQFRVDAFFVELNGLAEPLIAVSRYYLGLFSHRRNDHIWKGMLQIRLEDAADDAAARSTLGPEPVTTAPTGTTQ